MSNENPKNNSKEAFPGYPHHPASQDITNNENKVPLSEEVDPKRPLSPAGKPGMPPGDIQDTGTTTGDNTNVTKEERALLDESERGLEVNADATAPARAHLDETDMEGTPLNESAGKENFLGDDLVVPGAELDDAAENIGAEDEENNYYSLSDNNDRTEGDND